MVSCVLSEPFQALERINSIFFNKYRRFYLAFKDHFTAVRMGSSRQIFFLKLGEFRIIRPPTLNSDVFAAPRQKSMFSTSFERSIIYLFGDISPRLWHDFYGMQSWLEATLYLVPLW